MTAAGLAASTASVWRVTLSTSTGTNVTVSTCIVTHISLDVMHTPATVWCHSAMVQSQWATWWMLQRDGWCHWSAQFRYIQHMLELLDTTEQESTKKGNYSNITTLQKKTKNNLCCVLSVKKTAKISFWKGFGWSCFLYPFILVPMLFSGHAFFYWLNKLFLMHVFTSLLITFSSQIILTVYHFKQRLHSFR